MGYIKIPKVYEKLKKAEEFFSPVIMTAASGWGKSAAVEYYYRRKNPLTLYCENGKLNEMPSPDTIRKSVVIIEDLHRLSEEKSISYLRKLIRTSGIQVIMLTRGQVPGYLAAENMDLGFIRIQEKDFAFGEKEVAEFFEDRGVEINSADALLVAEASHGYPRAVYSYSMRMEGAVRYSDEMKIAVWLDMYLLWDSQIFDHIPKEMVHFAMSVCQYDSFTLEMAEYLTGNKDIFKVIEYCRQNTTQLSIDKNGQYCIRPEVRGYYRWKQNLTWSSEEKNENFSRAAYYYEIHGDITNALKFYKKSGETRHVKELLIKNANTHPGIGHYVETKDYYFELPLEEFKNSPVLISGMSMLYSLILLPEKSEEWYDKLVELYHDKMISKELRKEAKARIAYLDIGLPHRGTKGILGIMKNVFTMMQNGDVVLPEFSATGNMPSIMNGGLDFCEWSKNDVQIAKFMGKPVSTILGDFGKGLVTLCLAESGFEKGTMSAYEVLTRCNDGFDAATHGGKIEMCFVSVGIQVRQHLVEGQYPSAKRIFDSFTEKTKLEEADQLSGNIAAFGTWLSLFAGSGDSIEEYISSIPDAKVTFSTFDRYRQMVKLRCYIAENRLEEAFDLTNFMTGYFCSYNRTMYWIENEILKSIILYRLGDSYWKKVLHDALKKASEYHFVRMVAIEGAAILPLIKQMREDGGLRDIEEEYAYCVYYESIKVASSFPDYLKFIPRDNVALTNREFQVLSLLCAGMPTDDICKTLGISYDGLKKHNKNVYRKLGVKGRAEAERKASQLGLIHRGVIS